MRCLAFGLPLLLAASALCDEGMWLPNQFPKARAAAKYGVQVSDQLLDHLRASSVKMGASGSFVSPNGLLFTNHHVGLRCVQSLSSPEHNYVANGFLARTNAEELRCPSFEASVLTKIDDVTAQLKSAVTAAAASAEAGAQRKAAIAALEKNCPTGLRCEVVKLYAGARYHLYSYKRYTDVRLVFTPEFELGFFGGDPDNFTYPRYCLDVNFFRAYEDGKPAKTPEYLKWSKEGAKDGEFILVSGHPGGSSRLATVTELNFRRDNLYPFTLERLNSRIGTLMAYGKQGPEQTRQMRTALFGAQNTQKRTIGFLAGLRDPEIMKVKQADEAKLRAAIDKDAGMRADFGGVWDKVGRAMGDYQTFYKRYALLEMGAAQGSELFSVARRILRASEERGKPDGKRLSEFNDAAMAGFERRLFSSAPIYAPLETVMLSEYLEALSKVLGAGDPLVKAVLGGRTPAAAAKAYVKSSKLADVAERRRLNSDKGALAGSQDGMIRLARLLDPEARAVRKRYDDTVDALLTAAKSDIAQARFKIHGDNEYPDATSTLRFSYAQVKGYGKVPWATTYGGLFKTTTGQDPYTLPKRWLDAKSKMKLDTPFNFIATSDTHGGNSGSPTVNAKGEIVGILFDGNLAKFPNEFVYTDVESRSVHVASQGVLEALRSVFGARELVKELLP